MVEKHQNKWMDQLPFILLGKRVALQPDIGASPCELAMGLNVRIPGQILRDPGEIPSGQELRSLLEQVRANTNKPAVQTSNHSRPPAILPTIPENVTHVYTKQHKAQGLQPSWEGPFPIVSRPSRSTVQIDVGSYKGGERRHEIRHFNDLKLAHPDSLAAPAERPKLGRPSSKATTSHSDGSNSTDQKPAATSENQSNNFPSVPSSCFPQPSSAQSKQTVGDDTIDGATSQQSNHATSTNSWCTTVVTGPPPAQPFSRQARSTRNPFPRYVDAIWSASNEELNELNAAINAAR